MSQDNEQNDRQPKLVESPRPFFVELIDGAVSRRNIPAPTLTKTYLVDPLEHYMFAGNLFARAEQGTNQGTVTLAELYLKAANSEPSLRTDLFKKLGDTSLYISGFFGDSLHRKVVDIDYYAEMGGAAYQALASEPHEEKRSEVFMDLSRRFLEYVELLTYISQQAMVQTDADVLRLYSRYLMTGSELAKDQLMERGVLNVAETAKVTKQ